MSGTVCIVSLIRAPLEQLRQFLAYNQNLGVDRQYIFLDDPGDPAFGELADLRGVSLIPVDDAVLSGIPMEDRCELSVRQMACERLALEWAREEGHEWIVHIDNDELIYPVHGLSLKQSLAQSSSDVVVFKIMEAVTEKLDNTDLFQPTLFKVKGTHRRRQLAHWATFGKVYFQGQFLRGHFLSKCAVRISDKVVSLLVHRPVFNGDYLLEHSEELALLHYDCVGYAIWNDKWMMRHSGLLKSTDLSPHRSVQSSLYIQAKELGPDAKQRLFRSLYMMTPYTQFVLSLLGLMRRVAVSKKMFTIRPDPRD